MAVFDLNLHEAISQAIAGWFAYAWDISTENSAGTSSWSEFASRITARG